MNTLHIASLCLLGLIFFTACDKNDDNNTQASSTEKEYHGTAQTIIRYYEFNPQTGQDDFIEEKQYDYPVTVFVSPPLEKNGMEENNPINLQVFPDRSNGQEEEGHLDLSSALIFALENDWTVLQYWDLTLAGNDLNGHLSDAHLAEAAAANLLWAWDDIAGIIMTMPFALKTGCTLQGSITDNSVQLSVSGESEDTYRKFQSTLNASR